MRVRRRGSCSDPTEPCSRPRGWWDQRRLGGVRCAVSWGRDRSRSRSRGDAGVCGDSDVLLATGAGQVPPGAVGADEHDAYACECTENKEQEQQPRTLVRRRRRQWWAARGGGYGAWKRIAVRRRPNVVQLLVTLLDHRARCVECAVCVVRGAWCVRIARQRQVCCRGDARRGRYGVLVVVVVVLWDELPTMDEV